MVAEFKLTEALGIMDERNIRVLHMNEDLTCRGLLSLFKMSKVFFPAPNRLFDSRRVNASLRNLATTLNAQMLFVLEPNRLEDLILMVGAMSLDSFAKRLPLYPREKMMVIVGNRRDVQELAVPGTRSGDRRDWRLARGKRNHREGESERGERSLSPHDSAATAMLARASITVDII